MSPKIKSFGRQKENNAIVQHTMYEIILQQIKKLSAEAEAKYNIGSEIDENDLYEIDNMSLDKNKENAEWRKYAFESELENKYDIEIQIGTACIHVNEVNKISECNLLHDILNPPKLTKMFNKH